MSAESGRDFSHCREMRMLCCFKRSHEAELVGEIYFQLRSSGIDARPELCIPSDLHAGRFMRVDLGILRSDELIAVIECKRPGKRMSEWTRQAKAYRAIAERYDIKAFFVNEYDLIPSVVSQIMFL